MKDGSKNMADETLFTFRNIYNAYIDCRKKKRNTANALKFELQLEDNLWSLVYDLQQKIYQPGRSVCFAVKEPTIREVFAADFKDRVVHHLFVRAIEPYVERLFIYDNYACRKGKGTLFGMHRMQKFIRQIQNQDPRGYKDWWYLKADIAGFFMHIDQDILYRLVKIHIRRMAVSSQQKRELLWLAQLFIYHDPTQNFVVKGKRSLLSLVPRQKSLFFSEEKQGLPIGNLTSQFFANIYLNELDQFVKRTLRCKFYGRYVDDFFLIDKDKKQIMQWKGEIEKFLYDALCAQLHPRKFTIQRLNYGIDFVGFFVKPYRVYPRKRIMRAFKNKVFIIDYHTQSSGKLSAHHKNLLNASLGHFAHVNARRFLAQVTTKYPWVHQYAKDIFTN